MDLSVITPMILQQGPAGAIILYLLMKLGKVEAELQKCQEARIADLSTTTSEVKAAFATSTEVLRANTSVQEKATGTVSRFGEQIVGLQNSLEGLKDRINQIRGSQS